MYGLHAANELLLEIGISQIEQRVLDLTGRLIEGLRLKGYRLVTPTGESERSGIVVFQSDRHSSAELCTLLKRENVIAADRGGVRLSPHFYNSETEIDQVLDLLP